MKHISAALVLAAGLLLSPPLSAQAVGAVTDTSLVSAALHPGDIVRLRIWREPDLSGDYAIDGNGVVTFPMLGPMRVLDESTSSLQARLIAGYQEFLRNPSIEVMLLRRVNILGAVRTPGLYPVDPTMTIADAVALAGGATPDGDRRKVELVRDGRRIEVRLADAVRVANLPLRSGDQIFVPERSWFARNQRVIISAGVSLIIASFLR